MSEHNFEDLKPTTNRFQSNHNQSETPKLFNEFSIKFQQQLEYSIWQFSSLEPQDNISFQKLQISGIIINNPNLSDCKLYLKFHKSEKFSTMNIFAGKQ